MLRHGGKLTESTQVYRDINADFDRLPSVLSLSADDERSLSRRLRDQNIDTTKPIMVFGLRDMAYYNLYAQIINRGAATWRSNTAHRCPPLESYVRVAEYWAKRGYQVVRMGLRVSEPLPPNLHPNIVDYASGERSDDLDVYLLSHCRFMVAGDTGLFCGAAAFDRPAVLSDLYLLKNNMFSANKAAKSIFIPKLLRDVRTGEFLTFREHIFFNDFFSSDENCEKNDFEMVANSVEDIVDATVELTGRLDGTFVPSAEDEELQARFHAIYAPAHGGYRSTALISASFLRKYRHLID